MHGTASIWFLFCHPRFCQRCEAFADQRALARSTDTGDQREAFFGEGNTQILQIMNTSSVKGESRCFLGFSLGGTFFSFAQISAQFEAFNRPPATRQRKSAFLPQRLSGQRCLVAAKLIQRPGGNYPSAVDTRSGAQVNDVVCLSHGVFIMFHHDERVAPLLEPFEGSK